MYRIDNITARIIGKIKVVFYNCPSTYVDFTRDDLVNSYFKRVYCETYSFSIHLNLFPR